MDINKEINDFLSLAKEIEKERNAENYNKMFSLEIKQENRSIWHYFKKVSIPEDEFGTFFKKMCVEIWKNNIMQSNGENRHVIDSLESLNKIILLLDKGASILNSLYYKNYNDKNYIVKTRVEFKLYMEIIGQINSKRNAIRDYVFLDISSEIRNYSQEINNIAMNDEDIRGIELLQLN